MKSKAATAHAGEDPQPSTIEAEPVHPQFPDGPNVEEIRQRAYEIHLQRGGAHGQDQDDWLQAERELAHRHPGS